MMRNNTWKQRLLRRCSFGITLALCIVTLYVGAKESHAQPVLERLLSLEVERKPLASVIETITEQTAVEFIFSPDAIDGSRTVSFHGTNVKLGDLLARLFMPLNVNYEVVDERILLFSESAVRQRTLSGTVVDETEQGLQGATVRLVDGQAVTKTAADGSFTLQAPSANVLLEVSFIGYETQQVAVEANRQAVVIRMQRASILTDEVVVTALGITRDNRKIGYASTKVDGGQLDKAREPNVAYSLQGRVPGLNISGVNSGPGASARILVRGISNFSSSTGPLIVIDGVPMDNSQRGSAGVYGGQDMGDGISSINPDDIENIVVLKGSAASALYGARASNGVLQITTKSGKGQQGVGVEYNGNFSLNSIVDLRNYQQVYGHGTDGVRPMDQSGLRGAGLNSWGEMMSGQDAVAYNGNVYPYLPAKRQWQGYYRTAPVYTNTVSVLNGGDRGNFRFSFSHLNNQSVQPKSGLNRYNGSVNINHEIVKGLKLSAMATYIDEQVKLRTNLNDMSRNANFTMALLPANIHPDYLRPGYDSATGYEWAMNSDGYQPNPWFVSDRLQSDTRRKRLLSSVSLRYDISDFLYIQGRGGYDYITDDVLKVEPTGIGYKRGGGIDELSRSQLYEMNADIMAGYNRQWAEGRGIDVTVGGNIRKYDSDFVGSNGNQFKQPFLYTLTNLETVSPMVRAPGARQTNSGYYAVDLSVLRYLTVSTTGRYDVFSTLPKGSSGIFTPSVSTSFVYSDLLGLSQLNFGKLRLSYAQTSGEADPYRTSVYYEIQAGTNQNKPFGNMAEEVIPNTLKPYRMKEFEIGTEVRAFSNRVGLDVTYFERKTIGELIRKQISPATGYNYSYEALGSTRNRGVELMLTGTLIAGSRFSWNASLNHTAVSNRLLKIDDTDNPAPIRKAGEGQYRPSVGPYNNGAFVASVQGMAIAQLMAYDYRYDAQGNIVVGINGIPMRGALTPMGSGLPRHYGGLNNEFTIGSVNFSFLIDYKFGNKVLSGTDFLSTYYGLHKRTLAGRETGVIVAGVTESGGVNDVLVDAEDYYKGLMTNVTSISVYDGSFIKFRQAIVGYNLPSGWIAGTPVRSASISLVGRNLFTIMRRTDNFDPEASFSSLPGNSGLEGGGLPLTRTYGINVSVKF